MDLIAALGAAPTPPPARDRDTPDRAPSGERQKSRNEFDEALDAAAPPSSPSPSGPRAPTTTPQRPSHEAAQRIEKEAARAAIESEIVIEPAPLVPLPGASAPPTIDGDGDAAEVLSHDEVLPVLHSLSPSPVAASPAAVTPAIPTGDITRDISPANEATVAIDAAKPAAHFGAADNELAGETMSRIERIRSAIAQEDKTRRPDAMLRPDNGKAEAPAQPITARPAIAPAEAVAASSAAPTPVAQPAPQTLNAALVAALKDLPPSDLTAGSLPAGLLEKLGKAKAPLSAPDATRLLDKLRLASQPPLAAETAATVHAESAPQTPAAPKLEILHQQPHVGALDAARQVIAAIRTDTKGDAIEVRLDPPELGRVRIHFTMDRPDSVTAVVTTDRSDTLDTMRRHAGDLAKELSRAGFANVELQFKSGGERSHSGDASKPQFDGRMADEKAAEPANFIYARARLDGRLDRLV